MRENGICVRLRGTIKYLSDGREPQQEKDFTREIRGWDSQGNKRSAGRKEENVPKARLGEGWQKRGGQRWQEVRS